MKITKIIILSLLTFSVVSCDDFLDVRPKAEKLERDLFENAQGFEDAIYGVYGALQQTSLYGKDLQWGVPEVLAQNLQSSSTDNEALAKYQYDNNDNLRTRISSIWTKAYETIGYANNILNQLNDWSPSSLPLYNYYKGEMLGVRAMLHFDLVRLFASLDMESTGIPYVTTYSDDVKPFRKVGEVYQLILDDLLEAETLLSNEESMITYPREDSQSEKFLNYQQTHMNLYAVRALLARVYWMKGDMTNAAKYAESVINSGKFPLIDVSEVQDYLAGHLSPKETIFGVYSTSFLETANSYLYTYVSYHSYTAYYNSEQSGTSYPYPYKTLYSEDVLSTAQDYRLQHFVEGIGLARFLKLVDYQAIEDGTSSSNTDLISGITLIHASEMYLIAAEALLNTNYEKALEYFDAEIQSRGLTSLKQRDVTLTSDIIYNEYHKELFGEGQVWFNMKRLNRDIESNAEDRIIPGSDKVYVIPIPEEEYEYRN